MFARSGPRVHGAGWQHDGSARNLQKLSYGNCFVTAGIVVRLPFCSRAWCLPVLARLHLPGKGAGPSKVTVAAQLVTLLAAALPGRRLHVVADAACHGPAAARPAGQRHLDLPAAQDRSAVRTGAAPHRQAGPAQDQGRTAGHPRRPGRNRHLDDSSRGHLPRPDRRQAHRHRPLWYGSFRTRPVTMVLVRDETTTSGYDLALVTTGTAAAGGLVTRYAMRWSCEQSCTGARNVLGAGEARNRTRLAVERTVPFGMLVHTLIVVWYARHGYDQADIDARRDDQPWYADKTEPAFEDMLIKLRRTLIATRFSAAGPAQPTTDEIRAVTSAWAAAAA